MGVEGSRGGIWLRKGCCVGGVRDYLVESAKSECLTATVLGRCCFETKFGGGRDSEVFRRSGQMGVGSFLPITLDVVEVRLWRGLGMFEIEGCVAGVRQRLGAWNWFRNFA